jgi:predicted RNase H-like HicB family nuclease
MTATAIGAKTYTYVIERCRGTTGYTGYVPGWPGAHSQGETLEELKNHMQEVIDLLLEDGEPDLDADFYGVDAIRVS